MPQDLIVVQDNEPRAGTFILSRGFQTEHRALRKLVIKYRADFEEFGVIASRVQKPTDEKGGRPVEEFMLNEEQAAYLSTLLTNGEVVRKFRRKLIHEFYRMRRLLLSLAARQQNAEWLTKRDAGKLTRKAETDTIKAFVDYAKAQGSQHADKYYMLLSKMENQALFLLEQEFPNLRQVLSLNQLSMIEAADRIVAKALADGMTQVMFYKDIYKLAKARVEGFAEAVGKTVVPVVEKPLGIDIF